MSRPRSGIVAELAPLVLIMASLAGSLALVISIHRREAAPRVATVPASSVAFPPSPQPPRVEPAPAPTLAPVASAEEPTEVEPPPPPPDPTPAALARLTSAEAEQLLEASKADRKAAALEAARAEAEAALDKFKRREALVHAQIDDLDSKARKLEANVARLAFERDALLKERDYRKAAAARPSNRPSQAILPHKGPNGTWRRPIIIECSNGQAIIQPYGVAFNLMELESGYGPGSNPFVATVGREAVRIQGKASPDGKPVVPYIFFVVRPDGIRPYYEARGRLEPLGITFGYELADQDWEIDYPNLDDTSTWDGSTPRPPAEDPRLAASYPSPRTRAGTGTGAGLPAEDAEFPNLDGDPSGRRPGVGGEGAGGDFAWPARAGSGSGTGSVGRGQGGSSGGDDGGNRRGGSGPTGDGRGEPSGGPRIASRSMARAGRVTTGFEDLAGTGDEGQGQGKGPGHPGSSGPADLPPKGRGGSPGQQLNAVGPGDLPPLDQPGSPSRAESPADGGLDPGSPGQSRAKDKAVDQADPGSDFVWPASPAAGGPRGGRGEPGGKPMTDRSGTRSLKLPATNPGDPSASSPPSSSPRPTPFGDDSSSPGSPTLTVDPSAFDDPSQLAGNGQVGAGSAASGSDSGNVPPGGRPNRQQQQQQQQAAVQAPSTTRAVIGEAPGATPPPGATSSSIGLGSPMPVLPSPGMPPLAPPSNLPPLSATASLPAATRPKSANSLPALPDLSQGSVIDRTFEVVVVCTARGVIVQPGGYRVTNDALKDRDGLFKKQIVGLVKGKRAADPNVTVEPSIRFLVTAGGMQTYRVARSQFLLSGLPWPSTTQVADPDPLSILPSEGW